MSERVQLASRSASTSWDGVPCASTAALRPNSDHPLWGVVGQLVAIDLLGFRIARGVEQTPHPTSGRAEKGSGSGSS